MMAQSETRKGRTVVRADGISADLRDRASRLLTQEIRFVYVPEFEQIGNDQQPIRAAETLLAQIQSTVSAEQELCEVPVELDLEESSAIRNWSSGDPLLTFEHEQVLFRALNLLRFRINQFRARLSANRPAEKLVLQIESMVELCERIRSQLVNSNLRLVSSIARKFASSGSDADEFSSDGCMILLGAIDRFDYSRGFRFSTYATHSIQRHFFRAWKLRQRRRERFPNTAFEILQEVAEGVAEEPVCLNPEQVVADLLARADNLLDDREQQILMNRYGLGSDQQARTLREIAADLGISKERVRQLQMKALNKLREVLDPEGKLRESMTAVC